MEASGWNKVNTLQRTVLENDPSQAKIVLTVFT